MPPVPERQRRDFFIDRAEPEVNAAAERVPHSGPAKERERGKMAEREVLDAWMKSLGLDEYDGVLKDMGLDLVEDLGLHTRSPCRRARGSVRARA